MSLRTYTLSVSLAAIIGLLLSVVPLVRNILEYRSPSVEMTEPRELASFEAFVVAKVKDNGMARFVLKGGDSEQWRAMYDLAKTQHAESVRQQVESIRQRARHDVIAYVSLAALCVALLITHLLWARQGCLKVAKNIGEEFMCHSHHHITQTRKVCRVPSRAR